MSATTVFADLDRLVCPRSVALVGASDNPVSVGGRLVTNVVDHSAIGGEVFLVNPRRAEIAGRRTYASVTELPEVPDVAVIALAADRAVAAVRDCGERGIPYAVLLSSGFSEIGPEGAALERELREIAADTGIRLYGPNCPGLSNINARIGLNFSPAFAADLTPGVIGLATQGGGLGRVVLQAMERGLGVAQWLSGGNEADLDIADFIHHLAGAEDVKVIVSIIEGIKDGAKFAQAALRARQADKPIIAIKVGRSEYGTRAALSHTTAMTGEAAINSAVFAELGVIEVDDLDDLIDTAALFSQRTPGAREVVSIYTYSGGTAALAADMIGARGLTLGDFAPGTVARLRAALPRFGTHSNPVDTGTEILQEPDMIRASLEPVLDDPIDGVTLIPIPIEMGVTTEQLARVAVELWKDTRATIVPVWMTDRLGGGYRVFSDAGLVPSRSLSTAIGAIERWMWWGRARAEVDPTWEPAGRAMPAPQAEASSVGLRMLDEWTAKRTLGAAGVPLPTGQLCTSAEEAAAVTVTAGGPVAMKIVSADISHKTDIGGVRLNIRDAEQAAAIFGELCDSAREHVPDAEIAGVLVEEMVSGAGHEALVGMHVDPTFGPILTFGAGGVLVEVLGDHQRRLLPLTPDRARSLIAASRLGTLLDGHRGRAAASTDALVDVLVAISDFVLARNGRIDQLEINPLWVSADGHSVMALDALIVERGVDA